MDASRAASSDVPRRPVVMMSAGTGGQTGIGGGEGAARLASYRGQLLACTCLAKIISLSFSTPPGVLLSDNNAESLAGELTIVELECLCALW